ncbi:MAG: class I SAM-dependent methyltransferase [Magnetococcales bacterium]|nr:class I SAM-dependent methyltransferase [Magnetococcales bacterium]
MIAFYNEWILPWAINRIMGKAIFAAERARIVPKATGKVLEIGMGSGFNLPYYSPHVEHLFGLEPAEHLKQKAIDKIPFVTFPVAWIGMTAEHIPLESQSMDTVISTWTLCTVPDVRRALSEIFRVLKPNGQFLFIEHGRSPDRTVQMVQNTLNPLWKKIGGGCHLNRPMDKLILNAGFRMISCETGAMNGAGPLSFLFRGVAQR